MRRQPLAQRQHAEGMRQNGVQGDTVLSYVIPSFGMLPYPRLYWHAIPPGCRMVTEYPQPPQSPNDV